MLIEPEFDEVAVLPAPTGFKLRDYQEGALAAIREGWNTYNRLLLVMATGGGKTVIFSQVTREEVAKGGRVLILAHTEELLDQAADKLERSTGLESEREKADEYAGPTASVVVASVQTLARVSRLTGFSDDHFSLVIVDEAHRSLADSYQRVLNYFHFGAASLAEDWKAPAVGIEYIPKARVLGVTATADRGDKRNLGEFFQHCAYDFGMLEACRDGYLVRPIVKSLPLKLDLRGVHKRAGDYAADEIAERITPFLKEIAANIAREAQDRKTVCFLPSVETARLLSEALSAEGLGGTFVSGACPDRAEKIAAFKEAPKGSALCNAMVLIEGYDQPDVSCICVLRPTKVRSLFVQATGRGTRVLPGVIDGIDTPEARCAAIRASGKPDLLILDFLWLCDRLDLVKPVDLIAKNPETREKMIAMGDGDLLDMEGLAARDLLASLEKAARKHKNKAARTIDPLAWCMSLGDTMLAGYEPETPVDSLPADIHQLDFIRKVGVLDLMERGGVNIGETLCRGLASKIIDRVVSRDKAGLASPKQVQLLMQFGLSEDDAMQASKKKAGYLIGRRFGR